MDSINRNRIYQTMADWHVPREWADVMYRYLVQGLVPGGLFSALLANDARRMIQSSHPLNTINALKSVSGWISSTVPPEACDSYENVDRWCDFNDDQRWQILHRHGIVLSPEATTFALLKGSDDLCMDPELWYHH
jgi:hypothetical protein